ncbi:MAG: bifunctional 5,10-methylenetetrahydrofolate dehydrogenase/5,10-methenyltetrahydrofolate cyclohydrolase [Patescibacteria group bacterium]|jgi:methylenetetrahydrofolate dehydrogenase (NADP+)/methenyltetrahydrofolate cyclohydrolase|nr:bifunctional 5,10-methylenetetrahydrofolate dehydrogenase/5,10-methenyltetrahydrofolate cyclohydrolase [Patescibacteria group bacterium]
MNKKKELAKIVDGKKIAERISSEVRREVVELQKNGKRLPGLAILLIGEREDSKLYVKLKEKEARKVGLNIHVYRCSQETSEDDIIKTIEHLNQDDEVDAILVQLPLPEGFDTNKIIEKIDPKKDVDRFHPDNVKKLLETCSHEEVIPPVLQVVIEILKDVDFDLNEKKVCVISNSEIFGKSLEKVLECQGGKVDLISADDADLKEKTIKADLLISAVGRPEFIGGDIIKGNVVIIDIGITKEGKDILGDINFKEAEGKASFITPVPGGVGPVTVAMLLKNTLTLYKK